MFSQEEEWYRKYLKSLEFKSEIEALEPPGQRRRT